MVLRVPTASGLILGLKNSNQRRRAICFDRNCNNNNSSLDVLRRAGHSSPHPLNPCRSSTDTERSRQASSKSAIQSITKKWSIISTSTTNKKRHHATTTTTTTTTRTIRACQRQARWVIGAVCIFVTLQFLWTVRIYLALLSSEMDGLLLLHPLRRGGPADDEPPTPSPPRHQYPAVATMPVAAFYNPPPTTASTVEVHHDPRDQRNLAGRAAGHDGDAAVEEATIDADGGAASASSVMKKNGSTATTSTTTTTTRNYLHQTMQRQSSRHYSIFPFGDTLSQNVGVSLRGGGGTSGEEAPEEDKDHDGFRVTFLTSRRTTATTATTTAGGSTTTTSTAGTSSSTRTTTNSIHFPLPIKNSSETTTTTKLSNMHHTKSPSTSGTSSAISSPAWMPRGHDYGGLRISFDLVAPGMPRSILHDDRSRSNEKTKNKPLGEHKQDSSYAFDDDWVRGQKVGVFLKDNTPTRRRSNNNKKNRSSEPPQSQVVDGDAEKGTRRSTSTTTTDTTAGTAGCRRIREHRLAFPTCNEMHQLDYTGDAGGSHSLEHSDFRFINNGSYRQVFSYTHHYYQQHPQNNKTTKKKDKVAIKEIVFEDINDGGEDSDMESLEVVRMDAIVAERLSSSPRIYDIYGYCGLSILSEFFHHGDLEGRAIGGNEDGRIPASELHQEDGVDPQNNLTAAQKLVLALDMAEGLADLHGYENGLIIHNDLQLSQMLLNEDRTRLKLNDFNRAEFPLWDEEHQQYCQYKNGRGHGNWRSPEEYKNEPLTEAIDIWAFGNSLVGLLIGLNPNYELDETTGRQKIKTSKRVIGGDMPTFVDPRYSERSPEEGVLVQMIHRCFAYAPEDRPTIFEIVQELQQAVSELVESKLQGGISRRSILQQL